MSAMLDIVVILVIFGFPLRLVEFDNIVGGGETTCFQVWVVLGIFLVSISFRAAFLMVKLLKNPFKYQTQGDYINVDALISSSERCLFVNLRGLFGRSAMGDDVAISIRKGDEDLRSVNRLTTPPEPSTVPGNVPGGTQGAKRSGFTLKPLSPP